MKRTVICRVAAIGVTAGMILFCTSCRNYLNPPPKADASWPEPLSGVFVSGSDTLIFYGDEKRVSWHFAEGMDSVGLKGTGTYVFRFDGKAWRYDASDRFDIYVDDKHQISFGLGIPGSCNDTVITLKRFDLPGIGIKDEVFRKVEKDR